MILAGILITGFICAALVNSWWGFVRGPDLLTRTDNARRTISDRHVKRGALIDRNGEYLSESVGIPGEYERIYHYPILNSLTGYTNPYYGQAGIEANLDPILRGVENQNPWTVWFNHLLYGQPPPGLDVRLSIDVQRQILIDEMMGENPGGVILVDVNNGQILAMASNPSYDANRLVEIWKEIISNPQSPFVNRVTQGLYPPGSILDLFKFAASEIDKNQDDLYNLFIELGFYSSPDIRLPTSTQTLPEVFDTDDIRLSPLQMAISLTAFNNQGEIITPQYILDIRNPNGEWEKYKSKSERKSVISGDVVFQIIESLANEDLPMWHLTSVVTADNGTQITWFIGGTTVEAENNFIAVVVLEENDEQLANMIGESLLMLE
jgi:cell division protein FtsI/penicillin-binding protein 2